MDDAETLRLEQDARRELNWKRWGPYLAERQWGTVREDYSASGDAWGYFTHEQARSRAYRWGEDGLLGLCDREGRLCFALALWNERDAILKERLFGLSGVEGNHGEDVKECYFFLDATPTYSYARALYRYPQAPFPYEALVRGGRERGREQGEYEIEDTGAFEHGRYFDVVAEYAKAAPDDVLIRITAVNRGPEAAGLWVLPTLWFRNHWSWGRDGEGYGPRPSLTGAGPGAIEATHHSLGRFRLDVEPLDGSPPELIFTENETNTARLFGVPGASPYVKDAFHERVVNGRRDAVNPAAEGTKCAAVFRLELPPGGSQTLRLRLSAAGARPDEPFGASFARTFALRQEECDAFYRAHGAERLSEAERGVVRQGYAGLLWSKQFYHFVVRQWVEGDPTQPFPPAGRGELRNGDWRHLYNRDVISMPDTWEYPWYAAWDLAFHMIPFARIDPTFAKDQLVLLLREWYMHPNGQLPAYEYDFSNVNPPVHAWAAWRIYKMSGPRGGRDRVFLSRVFQKLLLNFTWWVNRKDEQGKNLFAGGFLGLDNIGVFDRSAPLPRGARLEQADATAWMAFYCATLLSMALELSADDPAAEDMASKFFEHFVAIVDAMNLVGGTGLWDEQDGFYYDQLHVDGRTVPLRVRSMVGIIPLFAVEVLETSTLRSLPGFHRRMRWFLEHRQDLAAHVSYLEREPGKDVGLRLLALPSRERLLRVLRYVLDEDEFLAPHGVRSLSRAHRERPYVLDLEGRPYTVGYVPGESDSGMFGGNSNWRGPVWLPLNYLLIEALERYHYFYGPSLTVECPTGSGRHMTLRQVAREISRRVTSLFLPDAAGRRPCHGDHPYFATDPHWRDLVLFHEYFHGETGRGLGASHQTGWTALAVRLLEDLAAEPPG